MIARVTIKPQKFTAHQEIELYARRIKIIITNTLRRSITDFKSIKETCFYKDIFFFFIQERTFLVKNAAYGDILFHDFFSDFTVDFSRNSCTAKVYRTI